VQAKQGVDLHTSSFAQALAADLMEQGVLEEHVKCIRAVYKERKDVMLQAMEAQFPSEVTWTRPEGGLFVWVTMPEAWDSEPLLKRSADENVAFVPGFAFYPDGRGRNAMRLNFSNAQPDQIREGIERLGRAMRREFM
jgi:DNA-binding transcriptional MocR family regulator